MILGIDPGLANCGWALVGAAGDLQACEYVHTDRSKRTGDAQARLVAVLRALRAPLAHASVVCIEWPGLGGARRPGAMNAMAASQTAAAAAAAIGLAVGQGGRRRILAPAPVTWRTALGAKRGRDGELHEALMGRYPRIADMRKGARPHVLDAVGLALYARLALKLNTEPTQGAA